MKTFNDPDALTAVLKLLGVLTVLTGFMLVSTMSHTDYVVDKHAECENVNLWRQGIEQGIEPHNRKGWPARTPEQYDFCKQLEDQK